MSIDSLALNSDNHYDVNMARFILKVVMAYFDVNENYYYKKDRKSELRYPRQAATYFIKKHTKMTLHRIGNITQRDHATVLHSVRVIENMCATDKNVKREIQELEKIINFKSTEIKNNSQLHNIYYHIDMTDFHSMKVVGGHNKAIIFVGFSDEEIEEAKKQYAVIESRNHNNTGMYILEKKESKNGEEN